MTPEESPEYAAIKKTVDELKNDPEMLRSVLISAGILNEDGSELAPEYQKEEAKEDKITISLLSIESVMNMKLNVPLGQERLSVDYEDMAISAIREEFPDAQWAKETEIIDSYNERDGCSNSFIIQVRAAMKR